MAGDGDASWPPPRPSSPTQLDACEQALEPFVDWSLSEVLAEEPAAWLDRLDVVQPALFAVMVALARLWQACGVEPAAVVGHSQGEIAAAHVAGGLALDDAARIVALRARAMTKIAGGGTMASVSVRLAELEPLIAPFGDRVSLAALNGPASLVVSGEVEPIEELLARCDRDHVRAQRVAVDYAAHSAQIEALEDELLAAFAPIAPCRGEIPFHSTLIGEAIDTELLGPGVLVPQPAPASAAGAGGAGPAGAGPTHADRGRPAPGAWLRAAGDDRRGTSPTATRRCSASLRRDDGGPRRFVLSLAEAQVAGAEPDWKRLFEGAGARAVPLPTYPFQRRRYWLSQGRGGSDPSAAGLTAAEHPILGASIEDPEGGGAILAGRISLQAQPWLADHAAGGAVLLPGTALVEMALRAGEDVGCRALRELVLRAPLPIPESGGVAVQVRVGDAAEEGEREVSIHARPEAAPGEERAEWTCHAQGLLVAEPESGAEPLAAWPPAGAEPLEVGAAYDRLAEAGFQYGPAFQCLTAAWEAGGEIFAELSLAEEQAIDAGRFAVHPALLDAAFHAALDRLRAKDARPVLPFAWRDVSVASPGASSLRVRLSPPGEDSAISLSAFDPAGAPLLEVGSVLAREVDLAALTASAGALPLYELRWRDAEGTEAATETDAVPVPLELDELGFVRSGDAAADARAAVEAVVGLLRERLGGGEGEPERIVLLSELAVAAREGEEPGPGRGRRLGPASLGANGVPGSGRDHRPRPQRGLARGPAGCGGGELRRAADWPCATAGCWHRGSPAFAPTTPSTSGRSSSTATRRCW